MEAAPTTETKAIEWLQRIRVGLRRLDGLVGQALIDIEPAREPAPFEAVTDRTVMQQLADFLLHYQRTRNLSLRGVANALGVSVRTVKNLREALHWPNRTTARALLMLDGLPPTVAAVLKEGDR